MSPEKMITMANQIATFFATQPGEDQAQRVADHLNDFWEPRMRAQLAAHLETGGEGLDPLVVQAASLLRVPSDG
ncbi:formate dehydrogenase subunit delta [Thalassovita sp.]|jgi:formate dehydrogenase subunit delta|uniref:formate dehydrogenase subunit delta n=1 Tax=Thalassovita sp. TaxID=1979401 RepID=UPI003B5CADED